MKIKRESEGVLIIALLLGVSVILIIGIYLLGHQTSGSEYTVEPAVTELTMLLPSYGYVPDDQETVLSAMNQYTREKLGIIVHFVSVDVDELDDTERLMLRSGETIDLMPCMGQDRLTQMIQDELAEPLDVLLQEEGQEILAAVPDEIWPAFRKNGVIYAVPALSGVALEEGLIVREDIVQKLQYPFTTVQRSADIDEIDSICSPFLARAAASDKVLEDGTRINEKKLVSGNFGYGGLFSQCQVIPYDGFGNTLGCVMGADEKVVNLYETEEYRKEIFLVHEWQNAGYIQNAVSQLDENPAQIFSKGDSLGIFTDTAESSVQRISNISGYSVMAVPLCRHLITTEYLTVGQWLIPAASRQKKAAMQLLNLMYSDPAYVNLYDYGIEGTHYQITESGYTAISDSYRQNLTWMFGNSIISLQGSEKLRSSYKEAEYSPFLGFVYESTDSSRIQCLERILAEYLPSLQNGLAEDPVATLDEMNQQLYQAGLQQEMEEKQQALDAWRRK